MPKLQQSDGPPSSSTNVCFSTFGMFIIDEIEWTGPDAPVPKKDLIGGAGTYAVLGARLASGQTLSKSLSWIVDVGSDFPPDVKDSIDTWTTDCVYRYDLSRLTTRSRNEYGANEYRAFKYLTPKIRLEVSSLDDRQILSKAFHMVCSPHRCISLVGSMRQRLQEMGGSVQTPIVVWEPIPDLCTPEELHNLQVAAQGCSVISPNADELRDFFAPDSVMLQDEMVLRLMGWDKAVDKNASFAQTAYPIIREGAKGCSAYIRISTPDASTATRIPDVRKIHLSAYHTSTDSRRVIDPTGGGNTYLGALALALTDSLNFSPSTKLIEAKLSLPSSQSSDSTENQVTKVLIAMLYAVIAASYAIEQNGVPILSTNTSSNNEEEKWNGEAFTYRMSRYLDREAENMNAQLTSALSTPKRP